jgi:hypothetical protein
LHGIQRDVVQRLEHERQIEAAVCSRYGRGALLHEAQPRRKRFGQACLILGVLHGIDFQRQRFAGRAALQ